MLKDSAFGFAAEMVMTGVALVNSALTFRVLDPDGRGVYFIAFSFASLSANVLGFRWERPTGYFLGKSRDNLPTTLAAGLLMAAAAPLLAFLIWVLFPPLIENGLLKNATHTEIRLSIALTAVIGVSMVITATYAGLREFGGRSVFMMISALATVAPVIAIAALGARGRDALPTFLTGHVVVSGVVYACWLAHWALRRGFRLGFNWPLFKQMFAYSATTYLSIVLNLAAIRFDAFLLNAMTESGGHEAGTYSITLAIANLLLIVPTILSTVLFARVAADEAGGAESTARLVRVTLLTLVAASVALVLGASVLVTPVFGAKAAGAVQPLLVLAPATIVLGLVRIIGSYLDGRGRGFWTSLCSLLAAVTVIGLDLYLIPRYGVMGLVVGALCGQSLALLAAATIFSRVTGLGLARAFAPRLEDARVMYNLAARILRRTPAAAAPAPPPESTNEGVGV